MDKTLTIPNGLSRHGRKAAQTVLDVLARHGYGHTGGCQAFYTPEAWKARGETYGNGAELVVVYDGGDIALFFDSYEAVTRLRDAMAEALDKVGVYIEPMTCWGSAI